MRLAVTRAGASQPVRAAGRTGSGSELVARAEVGHVGAGVILTGDRRAARDAKPDLAEAPVQDVRAVARAVHPRVDDVGRGCPLPAAPGDVLANRVAVRATQVVDGLDATDEVAVVEDVATHHV